MLLWLFFLWVSCLCALLIDLLVTTIVTSIVVISFETGAIIHTVTYFLATAIPLAAISYMISYHLASFSPLTSAIELLGATVFQGLVAILLGFPVWITGGVKWLAGVMEYGKRLYDADMLSDIALTYYLIAFLVFTVFYLTVKTVAGIVGKTLRIRHRIELTGSPIPLTECDATETENDHHKKGT